MRSEAQKILEDERHRVVAAASIRLSCFVRGMVARKAFLRKKKAAVVVQKRKSSLGLPPSLFPSV